MNMRKVVDTQEFANVVKLKTKMIYMVADATIAFPADVVNEGVLFRTTPPLQIYSNDLRRSTRLRIYFETVQPYDVLVCRYTGAQKESFYELGILCFSNGKRLDIDDLGVKVYLPVAQLPAIVDGALVRCVINGSNPRTRTVFVTINSGILPENKCPALSLGIISEDDLPVHYRLLQNRPVNMLHNYINDLHWVLQPKKFGRQVQCYGLESTAMPSLTKCLFGLQCPSEQCASYIRQKQNEKLAEYHTLQATRLLREKKFNDSLKAISLALKFKPGDTQALMTRGTLHLQMKQYQKARSDFFLALEKDSSDENARRYLIKALENIEKSYQDKKMDDSKIACDFVLIEYSKVDDGTLKNTQDSLVGANLAFSSCFKILTDFIEKEEEKAKSPSEKPVARDKSPSENPVARDKSPSEGKAACDKSPQVPERRESTERHSSDMELASDDEEGEVKTPASNEPEPRNDRPTTGSTSEWGDAADSTRQSTTDGAGSRNEKTYAGKLLSPTHQENLLEVATDRLIRRSRNQYSRLSKQRISAICAINFLKTCLRKSLIPKCIKLQVFGRGSQIRMMKTGIQTQRQKLSWINEQLHWHYDQLKYMEKEKRDKYLRIMDGRNARQREDIERRHEWKIDRLIQRKTDRFWSFQANIVDIPAAK